MAPAKAPILLWNQEHWSSDSRCCVADSTTVVAVTSIRNMVLAAGDTQYCRYHALKLNGYCMYGARSQYIGCSLMVILTASLILEQHD